MKEEYDIVIVGAGIGGSITAITASKNDMNVCIIDRNIKENIGNKVCGDLVDSSFFDYLHIKIGLNHPNGEELNQEIRELKIFAPDKHTLIQFGLKQYMLDRHKFGQRLVKKAMDSGATILDGLQVEEPIINENTVIGVVAKDRSTNKKKEIYGKIIIDASGAIPVLRDKVILKNSFLERNINKKDMAIAYREVRTLKKKMSDDKSAKVYLSNKIVPSGYIWVFPDGDNKVNIGLGVKRSIEKPQLKSRLKEYFINNSLFNDSHIIKEGGGALPTRRPLNSLVANGFMCVGDAGCQIHPILGGGIGPSMKGGYLAAITAIDAIKKDDVTQEMLWVYNQDYMNEYGASQTALDLFRIFIQSCNDDDLNFMLKYLVTEESINKINEGEKAHFTIIDKIKILLRGVHKLRLINNLRLILKNMQDINELCRNYPSPLKFETWERQLIEIYKSTYDIVGEKK